MEEDDGAGMQTRRQKQGEWGADSSWRVLADRLRRACRVPKPGAVLAGCLVCCTSAVDAGATSDVPMLVSSE